MNTDSKDQARLATDPSARPQRLFFAFFSCRRAGTFDAFRQGQFTLCAVNHLAAKRIAGIVLPPLAGVELLPGTVNVEEVFALPLPDLPNLAGEGEPRAAPTLRADGQPMSTLAAQLFHDAVAMQKAAIAAHRDSRLTRGEDDAGELLANEDMTAAQIHGEATRLIARIDALAQPTEGPK